MRRLSLLALLVLFTLPIFAKHVDVENAKVVASTFWSQNVGKLTRAPFSDVTSQTEFTNFYIFNTSDGFVIVSADDIAYPILGYSDAGNFDPQNIPVNMYEWLQGYEDEIQFGIENGISASAEIAADWEKLSSGQGLSPKRSRSVNALVQTRWNQGSPYNNLCPYDSGEGERTVTGCVATAMAQIMKYWNYPTQGNGSVTYNATGYGNQTANFGNTTYDWNNMLNTYSNSATSAQKNAVATLMYHCGVAVHMSYGVSSTGGSGAVTVGSSNGTAEYAMKNYFLYKNTLAGRYRSSYSDTNWKNMMYTDLDAGRPIIYTGRGDGGGHCFICDGYNNSNQFHFNWGWGGYCDGFYAINSLEPGTGGIGSGNGTYNESQSAIFGIEPNAGLFAIPNALTFSGLGESKTFMVRSSTASNQSWSASSNQSWLTVSPSTGAGSGANTTVTATASRNNTANERTATVTITQGSATTTVTVVQPSGIANDPGCFGTDGYDYIYPIESSHMVIICGEGFGYFTTGHKITKVKFTTVDGATTSSYTNYTNNSFTIKIYENGSTESLSSGYTSNIAGAMGTQVYSQNYTQTSFGEQEVVLNTPYTINETTNFWIAVVANGNSILRVRLNEYGEPISEDTYEGSAEAFDGKYLYTDTYNGTNYLNTNGTAYYTDESQTELQLYSIDFTLTFCTEDPSLLAVTPETLNFASAGGNLNFTVKANNSVSSNWSAVSSESWLTLSPTSGNGNGATTTVTATAAENVSGAERSATITVTHGSETKVITVTQPDGSIAPTNTWYGNAEYNDYNLFPNTYQIVIRPENYGNFEAGNKILKVRFSTYNGARTSSYTDYTNTSFTIKIYENSSMDNNLVNNGYTTSINNCLGTVAYSQNYTAESFASEESIKTHIVDLETPYTIRNGVNFWIAVVANGNTLFLCNDVEVGEPIEVSSYVSSMAIAAASGNYLYTESYSSTDRLYLNYAAYYTDNSRTTVQTYSVEYALSYYISDGDSPYMLTSDIGAIFLVSNTDLHYAAETMSLGTTDNLVVYPGVQNNGPDNATQPVSVSLKLGSEVLDEGTINFSETNALEPPLFTWVYGSPYSYTVTADQLNQMLITGTFDVCFDADYSGHDNNESNNTTCITVTRATPSFTISASASPAAVGTITGTGTYELGEGVNLVATPNTGYNFTNWTENGTVVSTNATYTFTATANRTLVANFTQRTYNVTATVDPANSGTISGNNSPYTYGTNVSLTANANAGYAFVNWTDEDANVVSTNANYQFTIDGNRTFVAHFEIEEYEITATANPTAGGSVTGAGTFQYGQTVTLNATANTGYTFTNWTENGSVVSSNAEYSFTATASRTLVANFQINTYNISATANPTAGGTISGAGEYTHGENVTLTATANTGYDFVNWTENGAAVSTETSISFTATADRNLVANFSIESYTISATASPSNGGTVSGTGEYDYGQTVTLSATPSTGYHFVNWTENGTEVSTSAEYSFTATADRTLVANFSINRYHVTATVNDPTKGNVTIEGETTEGMYDHGTVLVMTATATEGNHFVAWNDGVTDAQREYTVVADVDFVANFAQDGVVSYIITATANPTDGGTITGVGPYEENTTVTLNAIASDGYSFANWTENDVVVSTDAEYSFTATADRTLVANFTINTYTILVHIEGNGTVTYEGNELEDYEIVTVAEGATPEFTIIPAEGYMIAGITIGEAEEGADVVFDGEVDDENVYTFDAVTANMYMIATFVRMHYTITVNAGEHGTVTYNGEEITWVNAEEGSTPAFVITPDENYQIDVLSIDGNEVELTEEQLSGFTYTFEPVMSDMTFSVTFTRLNAADMLEAGSIAVYPNPNNGKFILSMESIEGDVTCQIVNANGSVIETREMSATDGSEFVFDCNVAPGVYFVRVISGDRVWTKSVVINR
ncbi:MAG: C10 family peptidase [Bacteroidales bacterium]|nr:C10 family peptidase [Bacteroidales bacterium]